MRKEFASFRNGRVWAWMDNYFLSRHFASVVLHYKWQELDPESGLLDIHKESLLEFDIEIDPDINIEGPYLIAPATGHGDQQRGQKILAKTPAGIEEALRFLMSGPPEVKIPGRMGSPGAGPAIHDLVLPTR